MVGTLAQSPCGGTVVVAELTAGIRVYPVPFEARRLPTNVHRIGRPFWAGIFQFLCWGPLYHE
ncbi:hypothetical protein Sulac_3168 [Sulfobacillus acidophilus DSM 10332]|uniref:Uncharacterized protein n=1 Tax=Sulfobacillus acidophilus (strain ATCC 700253 / DSM 10332 / NAL) TaxID=679936 RepID=G8U1K9_SULAD|nr:hypothetical protein Sulac_3168 [Sulfobacillus acidophilus DSM 10332]